MENLELPPTPPENSFAKKIPVMKTYSSDIAEALKNKQGSVLSIAFAEEKKRQQIHDATSAGSKKNISYIIFGILFLGISVVMVGSFFFSIFDKTQSVMPAPKVPSLIPYDIDKGEDITTSSKSSFQELIRKNVAESFEGKVKRILFYQSAGAVQSPITLREFENKVDFKMPNRLINSLNDEFFIGAVNANNANYPVMIFSINSFDTTFPGMNEWEKDMVEDLLYSFDIKADNDNELLNRSMQDKTVKNHPARILIDKTSKIVLIYGFVGSEYVVISTNEDAYAESVSRLLR
jgi:hypothetical protein